MPSKIVTHPAGLALGSCREDLDLLGSRRTLYHETQPYYVGRNALNFARSILLVNLCCAVQLHGVELIEQTPSLDDDLAISKTVKSEDFEALLTNSPFTRSLGVSDSLILTGIARVENDVFATLLDTRSMISHLVSKTANAQGWQLVGIRGNAANLQTLAVNIQIAGGEVIAIRYQKPPPKIVSGKSGIGYNGVNSSNGTSENAPPLSSAQAQEAQQAAVNYREGFSSDGYPKEPPPEIVQKLSTLSVGQRENINRQMLELRNKGLGMEERRKIYVDMIDRTSQGRR